MLSFLQLRSYEDISIVIPTLNEEESIGLVIEKIGKNLPGAEVIVVDSSDDKTAEIASSMGARVVKQDKLGYGAAIRAGLVEAKGRILTFMDGDGTYDPADLSRLVEAVKSGATDIATGLRFSSKPAGMSITRYAGNLAVNTLFSFLFFKRIRDTQTGMKVFSRDVYLKMSFKEDGMPFSTEVLTEAWRRNLRVMEMGIRYYNRIGLSKLNLLKDGLRIVLFMFRKRFRTLRD